MALAAPAATRDQLGQALASLGSAAETAWSGVLSLDPAVFTAYVSARLPADATPDTVARLHGADLYLACGCAEGLRAALASFESDLMGDVRAVLQRMRLQPASVDDLSQMVREKVLLGSADRTPKLAEYAGRGALRAWLRVVATRIALNAIRDGKGDLRSDGEPVDAAAPSVANPEVSYLRERHGRDLRLALDEAMQSLTAEQRTLLRQHYVEGLSCGQIARQDRVHPVTILRRLQRILEGLRLRTVDALQQNLGCEPSAADSVIKLALGHLALGIHRYLSPTAPSRP